MTGVSLSSITKHYPRSGTVVDAVDLEISEGEFFTLLGPSGCGKTTTLRMIAGFEEPTSGTIHFGNRNVTNLAVHKRGVGIVFQNYALFPHMSVGKNVAFGLKTRKVSTSDTVRRVSEALKQVHLKGFEDARVDELSGGQQQRVALARAIVIRPELLLLDEPLSNLDAKLRDETRSALRKLHAETGKTSIYVTHDQAEALAMSTRIAVMKDGKVHQIGTPDEIYTRPATHFVAEFIGNSNMFDGVIVQNEARRTLIRIDQDHSFWVPSHQRTEAVALEPGAPATLMIRSEDVRSVGASETLNVVGGVVEDVEFVGARLEVTAATPLGNVELEMPRGCARVGDTLHIQLPEPSLRLVEVSNTAEG